VEIVAAQHAEQTVVGTGWSEDAMASLDKNNLKFSENAGKFTKVDVNERNTSKSQ
jgi:hypothetical protein